MGENSGDMCESGDNTLFHNEMGFDAMGSKNLLKCPLF